MTGTEFLPTAWEVGGKEGKDSRSRGEDHGKLARLPDEKQWGGGKLSDRPGRQKP